MVDDLTHPCGIYTTLDRNKRSLQSTITYSWMHITHGNQLPDRDQEDKIAIEDKQHGGPRELLPPHIVDFFWESHCVVVEH